MKRREFITLLGGAAAAWPLAARAQQGERVRRIGVLMGIANDSEGQQRMAVFRKTLESLGWSEGSNIQLDYRWAPRDAMQARVRRQRADIGRRNLARKKSDRRRAR